VVSSIRSAQKKEDRVNTLSAEIFDVNPLAAYELALIAAIFARSAASVLECPLGLRAAVADEHPLPAVPAAREPRQKPLPFARGPTVALVLARFHHLVVLYARLVGEVLVKGNVPRMVILYQHGPLVQTTPLTTSYHHPVWIVRV